MCHTIHKMLSRHGMPSQSMAGAVIVLEKTSLNEQTLRQGWDILSVFENEGQLVFKRDM